jgi:hypothetical protein
MKSSSFITERTYMLMKVKPAPPPTNHWVSQHRLRRLKIANKTYLRNKIGSSYGCYFVASFSLTLMLRRVAIIWLCALVRRPQKCGYLTNQYSSFSQSSEQKGHHQGLFLGADDSLEVLYSV